MGPSAIGRPGPMGARIFAGGARDRDPPGYLLRENPRLQRENPRLQLQGDDTSDGAVFSVQHLFCSFEDTQVWGSHSDPLGASL
jgi:hypothetical protein